MALKRKFKSVFTNENEKQSQAAVEFCKLHKKEDILQ